MREPLVVHVEYETDLKRQVQALALLLAYSVPREVVLRRAAEIERAQAERDAALDVGKEAAA